MTTLVLRVRPVAPLQLSGAGDRVARSPAIASIPGEEPLLPRLETLVGSLASEAYRVGAASGCSSAPSWCRCSLEAAARLLRCSNGVAAGPLLLVETRGETLVYINASTGLLNVERLRDWTEAARLIREAGGRLLPRERREETERAGEIIRGLTESGDFVPWSSVVQRQTGIALSHSSKTVVHGLIYSYSRVDLLAAASYIASVKGIGAASAHLALLVRGCAPPSGSHLIFIGPRGKPALLEAGSCAEAPVELRRCSGGEECIVLSHAPLAPGRGGALEAVHPKRPMPRLDVYTRAYSVDGTPKGFRKDRALPALWPGTIAWGYVDPGSMCPGARLELLHALPVETLEELAEQLLCRG